MTGTHLKGKTYEELYGIDKAIQMKQMRSKIMSENRKTGIVPTWNKNKTDVQIPWNKGKKGLQKAWNKGTSMPKYVKDKISISKKGIPNPKISQKLKGRHLSLKTELKKGQHLSPNNEFKKGQFAKEKHPNWKGGITPIYKLIRNSDEMKRWRKSVFERDNYTCVLCGIAGNGKNLEADHIKPFAKFPELRFDVNNGRTLCHDCHIRTPTYRNGLRRHL